MFDVIGYLIEEENESVVKQFEQTNEYLTGGYRAGGYFANAYLVSEYLAGGDLANLRS